jgi:monoamine oxidase
LPHWLPKFYKRKFFLSPYGTNSKLLIPFSENPLKRRIFINDRVLSIFFDDDCTVLTMYYIGVASKFSRDTILQTYEQDRPMIEMGFGDACPPLIAPVIAKDQSFGVYEGPVGYSWPNDPYIKGSYSYITPGQETIFAATKIECGEGVKTLFAPIDNTLYFAGEHASILKDVPGTMEAACESGERVARMILKAHKNL